MRWSTLSRCLAIGLLVCLGLVLGDIWAVAAPNDNVMSTTTTGTTRGPVSDNNFPVVHPSTKVRVPAEAQNNGAAAAIMGE